MMTSGSLLLFTCRSIPLLLLLLLTDGAASESADGSWSEWSVWTPCSVSCDEGVIKRIRACNPPKKPGGRWCVGRYQQTDSCIGGVKCPVDGGWSEWSPWNGCSMTCGEGWMMRTRSCSSPFPLHGGRGCVGEAKQTQNCLNLKECPRDGRWSNWGQWSRCSVTCGAGGAVHRYRACNNPRPAAGGKKCEGESSQVDACQAAINCPVNGQWTEWTEWNPCSVTCGKGERSRSRTCDDPAPSWGGRDCNRTDAEELQVESCNPQILHCPVDGGWSEWSARGPCHSPDCNPAAKGDSLFLKQRSCNSPLPAHKGRMCQGSFLDAGKCSQPVNCRVDGDWSEWTAWMCTKYVATRQRVCDNPPPSNGGKDCRGKEMQIVMKDDNADEHREACPKFQTDDEDLEQFSGSGFGGDNDEASDG